MSLSSMTAFAREATNEPLALVIELRSVNHRYLDLHFKLPDSLRSLEPRMREVLGAALKRGKVDCFIRTQDSEGPGSLQIDDRRLKALLAALARLRASAPELAAPDSLSLLQFPGICDGQNADDVSAQRDAETLFHKALASLLDSRVREGEQLAVFLTRRLAAIASEVAAVRAELPALRERQEARLRKRLDELELPVDPGRLEQELVLLLQKSDVDEELDRLDAHIQEITRVIDAGGPCGRRLDFLMQELNREANTLSSKAVASRTTQRAVELKVLIEQMREQVQNVE